MNDLVLTGRDLTLAGVLEFERRRPRVTLSEEARHRMDRSVRTVTRVVQQDKPSYGINTGFGAFANQRISPAQVRELQLNLVRSHAAGVGDPLPADLIRRIMLLKANSLAAGYSGIRSEVVDTLIDMLNADLLPVIPSRGSVGASGDLAPLAHMTLALIGEGEATRQGQQLKGPAILAAVGRPPVVLEAKEGLALLNGTQVSAALAMAGLQQTERLLLSAILAGSLTVEGLAGSFAPFDARIHDARGMEGQRRVASLFRSLLGESEITSPTVHR